MKRNILILLCISFISNCFGMSSNIDSSSKKALSGIAALGAVVSGVFLYNKYVAYKKHQEERAQDAQSGHGVLVESHSSQNLVGQASSSSSSSLYVYPQDSLVDISDEAVAPELLKNRTYYLKVTGQEIEGNPTDKCGYMALFNALAIQNLFAHNKALTVENINAETQKFSEQVRDEQIESDQLFDLAQRNHVSNLYIVASGQEFRDGMYVAAAQTDDTQGDELLNAFKNKTAVPGNYLHFISNTGGHWVLASVVKIDNQKPIILFINTKNSPLTQESRSYLFLQNLWKCINQ